MYWWKPFQFSSLRDGSQNQDTSRLLVSIALDPKAVFDLVDRAVPPLWVALTYVPEKFILIIYLFSRGSRSRFCAWSDHSSDLNLTSGFFRVAYTHPFCSPFYNGDHPILMWKWCQWYLLRLEIVWLEMRTILHYCVKIQVSSTCFSIAWTVV